ncbi:hypothetical protein F5X68DRAFT_47612 [Plectosphaerella plurivora]|uniref:Uncharacterized protein n=1 Tax=Plectosphaerella plurivora TaxID=936078 RepID=A0A9P9AGQ3_9PEZI|nr:hypothetical protein F5X68DRAFT_47612 [Plectosphaerella plurivora]
MRTSPNYAPVDEATGTIPLTSSKNFLFYEPLILLLALNEEMRSTASYISPSEVCDSSDPEQLFKAFLNKLALVCDSSKGGDTVTAIWVSEDAPGQVEYHIASNQLKSHELDAMGSFVRTLLVEVRDADARPSAQDQANKALLLPILRFNRPRINIYLNDLRQEAEKCLVKRAELGESAALVARELQGLVELCSPERASTLSEPDYICRCQEVIKRLNRLNKSPAWSTIDTLGRDARSTSPKDCWSEFRHMTSRLVAYPQAVAFFLRSKATWPRLFTSFTVTPMPSSRRMPKMDVRKKSLTAESIVGRMTRRESDMKLFRGFVESLQLFQLDARIHEEFTKDSLRPVVHVEVLLLNRIEFSGGISPARFFGGWPYIGSSKPTCRLCHYYFVEHGSGVGHRASHGNLYDNWRFPDVRAADGAAALEARTNMMSKILVRVRRDAFDLVRRKAVPTYRGHDSATTSARVTLEERWSTTSKADDLASMMGDLGLEDEDEDGGARL